MQRINRSKNWFFEKLKRAGRYTAYLTERKRNIFKMYSVKLENLKGMYKFLYSARPPKLNQMRRLNSNKKAFQ